MSRWTVSVGQSQSTISTNRVTLTLNPVFYMAMGHSTLKEIDKLRFGKSSWETVFWEDLKILWIKWNGK